MPIFFNPLKPFLLLYNDSSPVHNLANAKKHHSNHYQPRSVQNFAATAAAAAAANNVLGDNETAALLENHNPVHIHAASNGGSGGHAGRTTASARHSLTAPQQIPPNTLPLQTSLLKSNGGLGVSSVYDQRTLATVVANSENYDASERDSQQAGSLGLSGGRLPRLRRWENLFKTWMGIRPSQRRNSSSSSGNNETAVATAPAAVENSAGSPLSPSNLPSRETPEITITRTPSEQNVGQQREKLAANGGSGLLMRGSSSSLNVVQQKLWNIMRREGSAASLYQEKSQSIVQYTSGLRKCETVLALSRQTSNSLCSPVLGAGHGIIGGSATGIFSASGVEQIRPLNRLRNSVSTMNAATCSRCSSLLSLAATGSRYSLNAGGFVNTAQPTAQMPLITRRRRSPSMRSNGSSYSQTRSARASFDNLRNSSEQPLSDDTAAETVTPVAVRKSSAGAQSTHSGASSSFSPPSSQVTTATFTPSTLTPTTPGTPTMQLPIAMVHQATLETHTTDGLLSPTSLHVVTKAQHPLTINNLRAISQQQNASTTTTAAVNCNSASSSSEDDSRVVLNATDINIVVPASNSTSSVSSLATTTQQQQQQKRRQHRSKRNSGHRQHQSRCKSKSESAATAAVTTTTTAVVVSAPPEKPFETFTCKLCLIDVESAEEATTLQQCGCQFCTECMKAYVEFEISEAAYDISCPDAQCAAQGIVTLQEIANLTTPNLLKKHHRYRLNREIDLDKSRTWCPRAGCETVCRVGPGLHGDAIPSTSTNSQNAAALGLVSPGQGKDGEGVLQYLCAVQCPSCKDEFCSACKKAWHPNISCEENSRRLAADGQDDIGIPFDNDLIKCCPMCAVPIEKDEGCAQMMCKRCKHVFCWYCLASLDDDFLLRHYDKGPCKNKLGHSRASVVWHRAQVIGIFAGFGILLLVASPLLLLAAPCIICCKCRICSGSKADESEGELDEGTALQS